MEENKELISMAKDGTLVLMAFVIGVVVGNFLTIYMASLPLGQ